MLLLLRLCTCCQHAGVCWCCDTCLQALLLLQLLRKDTLQTQVLTRKRLCTHCPIHTTPTALPREDTPGCWQTRTALNNQTILQTVTLSRLHKLTQEIKGSAWQSSRCKLTTDRCKLTTEGAATHSAKLAATVGYSPSQSVAHTPVRTNTPTEQLTATHTGCNHPQAIQRTQPTAITISATEHHTHKPQASSVNPHQPNHNTTLKPTRPSESTRCLPMLLPSKPGCVPVAQHPRQWTAPNRQALCHSNTT